MKRIRHTHRPAMSATEKRRWINRGDDILQRCDEIWTSSRDFDTAVRDTVADGLAYLVHSAFDCHAQAMEFPKLESWISFIENSTAEWFRSRGFVEWYCGAAASLFRTTPPRRLNPVIRVVRSKGKRKAA